MGQVKDDYGNVLDVRVNDGEVQVVADGETRSDYTPAQARELAAALLRTADEAEGLGDGRAALEEHRRNLSP